MSEQGQNTEGQETTQSTRESFTQTGTETAENETSTTTEPFSLMSSIPEEIKSKPYMQRLLSNNPEEKEFAGNFVKEFDNLQGLLGKKGLAVPDENSTPEDWNNFYSQIGRPETSDKYELDYSDMPEEFEKNEEFEKSMKDMLFNNGLSEKQAKSLSKDFNKIQFDLQKQYQDNINNEFETLTNESFGGKKEEVLSNAQKYVRENISPNMAQHIEKMDNRSLVIMADVLNNLHAKHFKEDNISTGNGGVGSGNRSAQSYRDEAKVLIMSEANTNPRHPEHHVVKQKISDLYKQYHGNM